MKTTKSTGRILQTLCVISIACALMLSACSGTAATAKEGDTVKVLYIGTYDNGSVFDSSELNGGDPLEFTIGGGNVIAGFEQAVIGMSKNESKNVHVSSNEAYGPYYDYMITTINWSSFEEGYVPEIGEQVYMQSSAGQVYQGVVLNTSEEGVTVDFNHPLAGMDLNFEITLVEIIPAE